MKLVLLALALLAAARADPTHFNKCSQLKEAPCEVHEARVEPCANPKECVLYLGRDASIAFDFTPQFAASRLKIVPVYQGVPFNGINTNGCKSTECPTVPGRRQTSTMIMHISKKYPKNQSFTFQWQLYDEDNPQNICCMELTVRLKKPKK